VSPQVAAVTHGTWSPAASPEVFNQLTSLQGVALLVEEVLDSHFMGGNRNLGQSVFLCSLSSPDGGERL